MNKQSLTFIGRDSGFGDQNNSAYFENNNNLFLIDCGFTVFQKVKNDFDLQKYSSIYIIITHLHNDHAGSLSQLILYLWFILKKKAIVITNCKHIKEYLDITGVPKDSYELASSLPFLHFIETPHVPHIDAYGFNLSLNNRNIIYTGDTNTLEPFLPYIDTCNELYLDVSQFGGAHIKIDEIIDKLNYIKNKNVDVFFMHMDNVEYIKEVTKNQYNYE